MIDEALAAWGAYDRDNPFPLFAQVRRLGAVHAVTLADGHDAYLVVRHAEARAALNDPRLSKDMQAALASGGAVVAEGLPGPAFARHMLVVDPPDHTRLRRLVAAAFSVRRIEGLRPHVQAIVDDLQVSSCGPANSGQPYPKTFIQNGDGAQTAFATLTPFRPSSLTVWVDNVIQTPTATTPAPGAFTLAFPPSSAQAISASWVVA